MPFLRQSYKQKPEQWGSFSDVQSVLFNRAEKIGINPEDIIVCTPFWERAGSTLHNYGNVGDFVKIEGTTQWGVDGFIFDGSTSFTAPNNAKYDFLDSFTYISNYNMPAGYADCNFAKGDDTGSSMLGGKVGYYEAPTSTVRLASSWTGVVAANTHDMLEGVSVTVGIVFRGGETVKVYENNLLKHSLDASSVTTTGRQGQPYWIGKNPRIDKFVNDVIRYIYFFATSLPLEILVFLSDNPYYFWQPGSRIVYSVPAASGTTDSLTAVSIVTGTPVIGTPSITQVHTLVSSSVIIGTPVLGTPTLTSSSTEDNLASTDIATGTPVLGTPVITQIHSLVSNAILTGVPVINSPVITQRHALLSTEVVTGTPVIGTPSLTPAAGEDALDAVQIIAGVPVITAPVITQVHALTASNVLTGLPVIGLPRLDWSQPVIPDTRIYVVQSENRTYTVPEENRTYKIGV